MMQNLKSCSRKTLSTRAAMGLADDHATMHGWPRGRPEAIEREAKIVMDVVRIELVGIICVSDVG